MWISKQHFDLIKDASREFRVWHEAQRQDWLERLFEKEKRINELRAELAALKIEADRMRLVLLPLSSPAGAMYAQGFQNKPQTVHPEFDGPAPPEDWASEMRKLVEEEEDGSHGEGRDEVRGSRSDGAS